MSKADKSGIVYSEKISHLFTSDEYDIYFFHCSKQRQFRQFRASFLSKKGLFVSYITIRMYARKIKQLTSHFDVTFELT